MSMLTKSLLLFLLNWLDAQLTIIWVRAGLATEGNALMARLLDVGDGPFLFVKLIVGAAAACVLYRFSHLPLARRGLRLALGVYLALMLVHTATGLSALDLFVPEAVVAYIVQLPERLLARA